MVLTGSPLAELISAQLGINERELQNIFEGVLDNRSGTASPTSSVSSYTTADADGQSRRTSGISRGGSSYRGRSSLQYSHDIITWGALEEGLAIAERDGKKSAVRLAAASAFGMAGMAGMIKRLSSSGSAVSNSGDADNDPDDDPDDAAQKDAAKQSYGNLKVGVSLSPLGRGNVFGVVVRCKSEMRCVMRRRLGWSTARCVTRSFLTRTPWAPLRHCSLWTTWGRLT